MPDYTIVDGDEFRLSLYVRYNSQEAQMDLRAHCSIPAGSVITDQVVASELSTFLAAEIKAVIPEKVMYQGATFRKLLPAGPRPRTKFTTSGNGIGTWGAVDVLPTQVCGLIPLYTDHLGKKWQGRVYVPFPGVDASEAATDTPTAAYLTATSDLAIKIRDGTTVIDGVNVAIVSFGLHPDGEFFAPFTIWKDLKVWATQRRRGSLGAMNRTPF